MASSLAGTRRATLCAFFEKSAMPFPNFDYCLLCDGVRFEVGNKFTILGFYGLTPNIEVFVSNPAIATSLAFLVGFPPVSAVAQAAPVYERIEVLGGPPLPEAASTYERVVVITRPDGVVMGQTPPTPFRASSTGRGFFTSTFVIHPNPVAGRYSIRILVDKEVKLDTSFHLRAVAQSPSRQGFACPRCKIAPPMGAFWECGRCKQKFDTFETRAVCPHCAAQFAVTMCLSCGGQHPLSDWVIAVPAPRTV